MKLVTSVKLAAIGVSCALMAGNAMAGAYAKDHSVKALEAAIAHDARPDAHTARDTKRKPQQILTFLGLKPGMKVLELAASRGYYTEIIARTVGKKGSVYAHGIKDENLANIKLPQISKIKSLKGDYKYAPGEADMAVTFMNYHDIYNGEARGSFTRQDILGKVYTALKPGGVLGIVDHSATAGSGVKDTKTLHRIDVEEVKADALKAGFVLSAQSYALKNASDDRSLKVHNDAIKGSTDRFVLKFTKL